MFLYLFCQERTERLLSLRNFFKQFSSYWHKEIVEVVCNDKVIWSGFVVYIQSDMMRSCLWNCCVNLNFYTIPYSVWVFFIGFKVCFKVVFFAKMTQSYYLISVVFKFLMKNIPTLRVELVAWQNCLYSLFFTLDLTMPVIINHGFEVPFLIFRLGVENGEFLLYRNFIFHRNNSKDKSVSFLYVFR